MTESRIMVEQVADLNKIINDLENIELKFEDKDQTLLFLMPCLRYLSILKARCCLGSVKK